MSFSDETSGVSCPIAARQLSKRYDSAFAVRELTFQVAAGEIFGLIGPNGAGKTTSLRMLAGLMTPTSGTALVCGTDVVRHADTVRGHIGFHTGSTGLYERLTVFELLMFFGRLHKLGVAKVEHRIVTLAADLGLEPLLQRRCGKLSTGERQRVSLARALIHDPPVLILDEPTSGLDVLASQFVVRFIRAAKDEGKAIIFSTHYMTEAELLCDRIGLIHRGELIIEGTPKRIKQSYGVDTLEQVFLQLAETSHAGHEAAPR
jgi:sodium transport system ATP-binding protein